MSVGKGVLWGIICLSMIGAFLGNFSVWDNFNLWIGGIIAISTGIMSYLEFNK